jgi:5,5'-dehydrodivanillate O-demethylase oxygenase subunit
MLNRESAAALGEVGAGSLIGDLLRRYWMPIASVSELDEHAIRPVRILGEDLVLYRDGGGTYGLLDRWCPHRRFDLAYGTTEDCGIRCSHHGWRFDETGACLELPFERTVNPALTLKDRIRTGSYPVLAKAGIVWTYLGADPAPLLPDWAGFHIPGFTVVAFQHVPCNWVQIMEGFHDPVHIEWLHDRWSFHLNERNVPTARPRHTEIRWTDFEYGVVFQRRLDGSPQWLADRTVVFPNIDAAAGQGWYLTWVVPIDNASTLLVYRLTFTSWQSRLGRVLIPPKPKFDQGRIPSYRTYASLPPPHPPNDLATHLISQDVVAWLGPGPLVDRTRERLTETDAGVIMFRRTLFEQAKLAAEGQDPKGVIRDPGKNRRISLPGTRRGYGLRNEGFPGIVGNDDVMIRIFLPAGIPPELLTEIDQVMSSLIAGVRPDWWKRRKKDRPS